MTFHLGADPVAIRGYALDPRHDTGPGVSSAQRAVRRALRRFLDDIGGLVSIDPVTGLPAAGETAYVPDELVILRRRTAPIPGEPLPDARDWPIETAPPRMQGNEYSTCLILAGPEVPALLDGVALGTQDTPWRIPDKKAPDTILARPVIPGDPGCRE